LEHYLATPEDLRTVRAASFGATLEMAREGELEIRQDGAFGPLFMRRKEPRGDDPTTNVDLPATHDSDEVK
ncbi:MAG: segregation/condensation protein A, partial [Pseudomonadota bacterium]